MSDTVRLFVFAPVIADGVTYCTDVTVAGNGATNTGPYRRRATAYRSGDDMPGSRVGSLVSHQGPPLRLGRRQAGGHALKAVVAVGRGSLSTP
jgi:hypothetical protein